MFIDLKERGREKHWCEKHLLLPPIHTPTRDQTRNLGMCPDWQLNSQPFAVQDDAPTNWANWPGQKGVLKREFPPSNSKMHD